MKNVTLMLVLCVFALKVNAQDATDALRYSDLTFGGTARGMGLAGAVGSLGADLTDLSVNPAGLGLYRSSEIVFTPSLFSITDATNYLGNQSSINLNKLDIQNFGLVFTHIVGQPSGGRRGRYGYRRPAPAPTPSNSKWKTVSFAIGYNRLNNFNENTYYQSTVQNTSSANANSSIANFWAQELNSNNGGAGTSVSDVENGASDGYSFDAGLGFVEGVVTNPNSSNTGYTSEAPSGSITQTEIANLSGYQNELDFSLGANYNNRWYFGVTLGVPTINFNENTTYTEESNSADITDGEFQSLNYNYQLSTTGTGINGKFGVIYRVNDFLRLGAAIHTPTWYTMEDDWVSTLSANIVDSSETAVQSPTGTFDYNLETPWRFVGSATILFKQYGFISADYEYVDYTQAYYDFSSSDDESYAIPINQEIVSDFNPTSIFRVGAEAAIDVFRIRAGFAYYGAPYQGSAVPAGGNQSEQSISGGVGLRLPHFFVDAAYVYSMSNETYYPFSGGDQTIQTYTGAPYATAKNTTGNIVLTVGYKF